MKNESQIAGPIVQFLSVHKSYDGRTDVVRDLNLDVARGEFLTLLGPSGSGKTTSLLMLAGFQSVSKGEIRLNGVPVTHLPPQKRNIGMVFQSYALFPHMTVAQNIAFPLEARHVGRMEIQTRVRRALEMVQLRGTSDRLPSQLSGGQQQRVAVARAVVFEPALVLMDEPLGALDKQLREEMQYEIMHLQRRLGVTVVYVTHDQSEALTMSSRIAVYKDGTIQQIASPDALYETPSNAFVARFIGENNRLIGVVHDLAADRCVVRVGNGTLIKAIAVRAERVGAPTMLSIRPERVTLGAAAAACENRLSARVRETVFQGDHVRVVAELCDQPGFIIKIPNALGNSTPTPGDVISVGWSAPDCRALDCDDTTTTNAT